MKYWIWYPGDMELYYAMKQNFSRVERGYGWPAFWKSEGFRNRVVFRRTYELKERTAFTVYSDAVGYVMAGEKKSPFGRRVECGPGTAAISIHAACIEAFPSVYIEGDVVFSDRGWMAEDYASPAVPVGYSRYFTKKEQKPSVWEYSTESCEPVQAENVAGGALFSFETELTAALEIKPMENREGIQVFCGESREEALDTQHCYYSWTTDAQTGLCPCCALRFAFVPGYRAEELKVRAIYQYVDIPAVASFHCDDALLNRIWSVAEHTFRLCSGIFFIDGVKRDKWLWCGDAYQSLFVNQYLMADPDINRRTLLALRGNDPMTTHINTIVDYSLLWILAVKAHYEGYEDLDFVRQVYPKMCSLMEFMEGQLDEQGFLVGREGDWIFVDWAEFDREGAFCPEQMLLARSYQVMEEICGVLGEDASVWKNRRLRLGQQIEHYFWDQEKQAYVDSFASGRRHVTRHANIWAILFDIADDERKKILLESVLLNEEIAQITTPYFKFYELEALAAMGCMDRVLDTIRTYWGGMLAQGAVTFWEEYDPAVPEDQQYDMYGDRFGKSLCHAWAASPIYFLEKYFLGVEPLSPGYRTFRAEPLTRYFKELDCVVPVNKECIKIRLQDGKLEVSKQ